MQIRTHMAHACGVTARVRALSAAKNSSGQCYVRKNESLYRMDYRCKIFARRRRADFFSFFLYPTPTRPPIHPSDRACTPTPLQHAKGTKILRGRSCFAVLEGSRFAQCHARGLFWGSFSDDPRYSKCRRRTKVHGFRSKS